MPIKHRKKKKDVSLKFSTAAERRMEKPRLFLPHIISPVHLWPIMSMWGWQLPSRDPASISYTVFSIFLYWCRRSPLMVSPFLQNKTAILIWPTQTKQDMSPPLLYNLIPGDPSILTFWAPAIQNFLSVSQLILVFFCFKVFVRFLPYAWNLLYLLHHHHHLVIKNEFLIQVSTSSFT